MKVLDRMIDDAFNELLVARSSHERQIIGKIFSTLLQLRNTERTPEEIARLERAKGLR